MQSHHQEPKRLCIGWRLEYCKSVPAVNYQEPLSFILRSGTWGYVHAECITKNGHISLCCLTLPGSNNYLTCVCVFVCVPFTSCTAERIHGGSGKVYLENAASRIRTVKINQRPSVTRLRSNTVNGIWVTANLKFEVSGQSVSTTLTFDWLIDSSNRSKCQPTTHVWWLIDWKYFWNTDSTPAYSLYSATGEYTRLYQTYGVLLTTKGPKANLWITRTVITHRAVWMMGWSMHVGNYQEFDTAVYSLKTS
jgi:hypothetical protein